MEKIVTTLTTEALFADDSLKRYLLRKTWDDSKPKLAIVMLAPSEASGIELDTTTQLVLNNCSRLGYGSMSIVNLFATLNDSSLKQAEEEDPENMDVIVQQAQDADIIVFAPGVGKPKAKSSNSGRNRSSPRSCLLRRNCIACVTKMARLACSIPSPPQFARGTFPRSK